MGMQLKAFRAKHFRSVDDSGLIETDSVTALIGINESGKSNLLLPLWKLNPAKDGEISPTADYPRKSYNDFRSMADKPVFIEATFQPDDALALEPATICRSTPSAFEEIYTCKDLDGTVYVSFPKAPTTRTVERERVSTLLRAADTEINAITPIQLEKDAAAKMKAAVSHASSTLPTTEQLTVADLESLRSMLPEIEGAAKTSSIGPRYAQLRADIAVFDEEPATPLALLQISGLNGRCPRRCPPRR